jgi:UDP-N-acetylmuramate: L-alanyl-gamma-D-glutamyl-meso-diaminopimelate ligase
MHLHILGISGTFMSALALLARAAGHTITGSDAHCYPPISDLLASKGISWTEGYEDSTQALKADCVIIGNAIKRGMPVLEAVLNAGKNYTSGPQWLAENILSKYRVLAVSGTHGKTTTTSMLAYILHFAGKEPGFLIGGVASDLQTSANLGKGEWFVIEADEYDSAFFDKRPKFMHYRPELAILNNLEFDHADIYSDLNAIKQQFHYFLRTIPSQSLIIKPLQDQNLNEVVSAGCFSKVEEFACIEQADWQAKIIDNQTFKVFHHKIEVAEITWPLMGQFNIENALAAIAASHYTGVKPEVAAQALMQFTPVKRRLEVRYQDSDLTIYDDFAHHPTAIEKTIAAVTNSGRHKRVLVILEFASFTMRSGVHKDKIQQALKAADFTYIFEPTDFEIENVLDPQTTALYSTTDQIIEAVSQNAETGDAILIMSNRGFDNIHKRLISRIQSEKKVIA